MLHSLVFVDGLGIWRGPFFGLGLTAASLLLEHRHMKAPYSIIVVNGLIILLVVNCFVGDAFGLSYNPQYSVNFFFHLFRQNYVQSLGLVAV